MVGIINLLKFFRKETDWTKYYRAVEFHVLNCGSCGEIMEVFGFHNTEYIICKKCKENHDKTNKR